jgi:hypothetical protein
MRVAAWFIAGSVVFCPVVAADQPPEAKTVGCELLSSKHLAVAVKVNGRGPYRMIFDTGAPVFLVSQRVAREAGLGAGSQSAKAPAAFPGQFTAKNVSVGGVSADAVPVTAFDHPTVKAISGVVGPIEGIIGYPFFGRYAVTVDYSRREISLRPNGHQPDDVNQALMRSLFARKGTLPPALAPAGQWGVEADKPDNQPGVRITVVHRGGSAEAAGLKPGDRLLSVNGRWTESVEDCFRAAAAAPAGVPARLSVLRDGRAESLALTPRAGL